jgi:propionate catabolism operon transcriptional regulator
MQYYPDGGTKPASETDTSGAPMIRISFIVPYAGMKKTVEDIFLDHPDRDEISQLILTKTVDEITDEDFKADIVIARGYSANRVKKASVPVLDITVTGFDITVALNTCIRRYAPKKIAVIGPLNTVYGIEEIQNVFPCEIVSRQVDDPEAIPDAVEAAVREGADAVIGGMTVAMVCRARDIASVMIESGRKTVLQAVDEAIRTVRLMRQERERSDRFKSIMDYSFEGIVSVDRDGTISAANNYARKVLKELEPENERTQAARALPQIDVRSVLSGGEKILGELVRIGSLTYSFNCVPAGNAGAVVTFSNISKIQELEGQIRSKLHKKGLTAKYSFPDIVGSEPAILETIRIANKIGRASCRERV